MIWLFGTMHYTLYSYCKNSDCFKDKQRLGKKWTRQNTAFAYTICMHYCPHLQFQSNLERCAGNDIELNIDDALRLSKSSSMLHKWIGIHVEEFCKNKSVNKIKTANYHKNSRNIFIVCIFAWCALECTVKCVSRTREIRTSIVGNVNGRTEISHRCVWCGVANRYFSNIVIPSFFFVYSFSEGPFHIHLAGKQNKPKTRT